MKMRLLFSFVILVAGMPAIAGDASLAGKWKYVSDVSGVHRERDCSFEQKDKSCTGVCKSEDSTVTASGTVDGDNVTLKYDVDLFGQQVPFLCTGKLNGPALAGTLTSPVASSFSGTCNLTRQ